MNESDIITAPRTRRVCLSVSTTRTSHFTQPTPLNLVTIPQSRNPHPGDISVTDLVSSNQSGKCRQAESQPGVQPKASHSRMYVSIPPSMRTNCLIIGLARCPTLVIVLNVLLQKIATQLLRQEIMTATQPPAVLFAPTSYVQRLPS
jgi:hypothetical protein